MKAKIHNVISSIIYMILFIISKIPLSILYSLSILFVIANKLIKYRERIIDKNIDIAFPNKNRDQKLKIKNLFYKNLYFTIIEIIKSITFKQKDIISRIQIQNSNEIMNVLKSNKSVILISSHYANWEWLMLRISLMSHNNIAAVYKPLSNRYINNIMLKIRTKFNANIVPISNWKGFLLRNKSKPFIYMLVADQSPIKRNAVIIPFFKKNTLFHNGPEKMQKILNSDVFYADLIKLNNGYYNLTFKRLDKNNITKDYVSHLSCTIKTNPQYWLWSHNRWKR